MLLVYSAEGALRSSWAELYWAWWCHSYVSSAVSAGPRGGKGWFSEQEGDRYWTHKGADAGSIGVPDTGVCGGEGGSIVISCHQKHHCMGRVEDGIWCALFGMCTASLKCSLALLKMNQLMNPPPNWIGGYSLVPCGLQSCFQSTCWTIWIPTQIDIVYTWAYVVTWELLALIGISRSALYAPPLCFRMTVILLTSSTRLTGWALPSDWPEPVSH